jgi:membrane-bound metal-dependent hydrolase YbcI (DUF457 family)
MPTPVGHAIAGLTIAWLADARRRPGADLSRAPGPRTPRRRFAGRTAVLTAASMLWAAAPDLDILAGTHRTATHSIAGAVVAGVAAGAIAPAFAIPALPAATVCGLAWGSHVMLDWLGKDSSPPQGIMMLWPISEQYYESGADVFSEVSRRYWKPDEFIVGNLGSVAREVLILGPVLLLAWYLRRRSTQG